MSLDPPKAFRVSQSASNLFYEKKSTLQKLVEIMPSPLLKIFATPPRLCLHACVFLFIIYCAT